MNSGASLSIDTGSKSELAARVLAPYGISLPAFQSIAAPVRSSTITVSTDGQSANAASTFVFSGTFLPPLKPSSAVMTIRQLASLIRSLSASGENPPKTTEWIAPIRVQANIA